MKKLVVLVLVVLLTVCNTAAVFATGPTITVGSLEAMPGETITIPVSISGNPGINTFSLGFSYDASKLSLLDVKLSSNLGGQFAYKKKAVWLNSSDTKYNGEILYLSFKVSDNAEYGESSVSVAYSPGDISNYNEDDVNFAIVSGKVLIGVDRQTANRIRAILKRMMEIIKKLLAIFHT